ncbi:MAG: hypothetical protein JWO05_1351 [Gemmatimonadetes bacterium]|nr:hypothetical protein [Gemmatimonadota bacterium]
MTDVQKRLLLIAAMLFGSWYTVHRSRANRAEKAAAAQAAAASRQLNASLGGAGTAVDENCPAPPVINMGLVGHDLTPLPVVAYLPAEWTLYETARGSWALPDSVQRLFSGPGGNSVYVTRSVGPADLSEFQRQYSSRSGYCELALDDGWIAAILQPRDTTGRDGTVGALYRSSSGGYVSIHGTATTRDQRDAIIAGLRQVRFTSPIGPATREMISKASKRE